LSAQIAFAVDVNLEWDGSSGADGYRLFVREDGQSYNYDFPDWEGSGTSCTIYGLDDGRIYHFVVRAYNAEGESGNSNEAHYPESQPILIGLVISGANSVNENSSSNYTATASFSDGSNQTVTNSATWSENSPYATINSNGVLDTLEVSSDQTVTVEARYSYGEDTETATKVVTIIDVPPFNRPPNTPEIIYPSDRQRQVEVPLDIATDLFSDPDGDYHGRTRWQISEDSVFTELVLDVTTSSHLTLLPVPHTVLKSNQTYFVRVRFYDRYSEASDWSDLVEFTTDFLFDDFNTNGIPDEWEVDDTVDFNLDGMPDNYQPEVIKCVRATDGSAYIGVEKASSSIIEIEALEAIDPETIADTVNRPTDLVFGLFSYRLLMSQPGAKATVKVYFSGGVYSTDVLYKYDTINGWYDFSSYTIINDDGQSILILEVEDGGEGDSDGVANGIIVDPGGIAAGGTIDSGGGGGGGGCVVASAAYGSPMGKHVYVLRAFRDKYLLPNALGREIIKIYERYAPPLAEFIEKHETLKKVVSFTLLPAVGFSYVALEFGLGVTSTVLLCSILLLSLLTAFIIKRAHGARPRAQG
jgi:hypothetical protein